MILSHINESDDATTVTASSETVALPATNLQEDPVAQKWRTQAAVNSAYLTINMGSQVTIRVVALIGTNMTSSATVRIRADNSDATATTGAVLDTGTVSANIDSDYGDMYYVLDADYTAQYWRIDIEDSTITNYLQAGRLFMGPAWMPSNKAKFGWQNMWSDPSSINKSLGQQVYSNKLTKVRQLQFTLTHMDEDEFYANAFEIDRVAGLTDNIIVMMRSTGSYISEQSIYGRLVRSTGITHETINVFSKKYTLEESK